LTFTNFTTTVSFADFSAENWNTFVRDSISPEHMSWDETEIWMLQNVHQGCKDLDWDVLGLLLVWVDKENSMEFPLNFLYYLYNYFMVCALSSHGPHVT